LESPPFAMTLIISGYVFWDKAKGPEIRPLARSFVGFRT